ITEDQWAQHEEDAVSYADLMAFIKGYYKENVDHRDQTDKLVQAIIDCLDKISTESMVKTTSLPEGPRRDKDSEGLKPLVDMEPLTNPVVDPLGTDANNDEEVFKAREHMYEDTQADEKEHQSSSPNKEQLESSHAQESNSKSSCLDALRKYDNILPLTERQLVKYLINVSRVSYGKITEDQWAQHKEDAVSYADLMAFIKGYYKENVDHKDQTDKLVQAIIDCLDKISTESADLLKALNDVIKTLKSLTSSSSVPQITLAIIKGPTNVRGENVTQADTEEPSSHTKGEIDDTQTEENKAGNEQEPERPTRTVPISAFKPLMRTNPKVEMMTSPLTIKLTDIVLEILNPNYDAKIELIG
nr:hypothetical protein [Tanacetum cinerariifolium]